MPNIRRIVTEEITNPRAYLDNFKFIPSRYNGSGEGYIHGFRGLRGLTHDQLENILDKGLTPRIPTEIDQKERFIAAVLSTIGYNVGHGIQEITAKEWSANLFANKSPYGSKASGPLDIVFQVIFPENKVYGFSVTTPLHGTIYPVYGTIESNNILGFNIINNRTK